MTLRDLRESAKLTQQEVAEGCNVTQAAVSRWEAGEFPVPRKYWKYLRHLLNCTDDELSRAINKP